LANVFDIPKDEIEADMDNCSFLYEQSKSEVFTESEEYAMMKHRDIILMARAVQGETNFN